LDPKENNEFHKSVRVVARNKPWNICSKRNGRCVDIINRAEIRYILYIKVEIKFEKQNYIYLYILVNDYLCIVIKIIIIWLRYVQYLSKSIWVQVFERSFKYNLLVMNTVVRNTFISNCWSNYIIICINCLLTPIKRQRTVCYVTAATADNAKPYAAIIGSIYRNFHQQWLLCDRATMPVVFIFAVVESEPSHVVR